MTPEEIRALPAVLNVVQAAQVMDVGLSTARALMKSGEWPSPVLRLGVQYRIPTAPLLAALGISAEEPTIAPLGRRAPASPSGRSWTARACRLSAP